MENNPATIEEQTIDTYNADESQKLSGRSQTQKVTYKKFLKKAKL